MQVRVLGAIEVVGEQPVALGGPTLRRTLAMLVVRGNHVVSVDQLVDAVWPDGNPPDRSESNVRTYVHRLRTALGSDGGRIETVGSGYRLRLDRDELDSARFEALVDQARSAAGVGDLDLTLRVLDEALVLWRGRPFDEFADEEWARAEVVRLTELHASAIEHRFAALLDDGRHTEVIGPLHEAIAEEPWREARRAQYALALYRAGRQAEALRAVQHYRSALADELGLDPSPDLQQLEHKILEHDPSLLPPSRRQHMLRGYELDEVVGEGAFSLVWRGVQPALGRTVAVKQIRADLANQPEFVRRFETEAQTVATLEHPYIVPLYDYWREPDSAYLVMRYVAGGTLESEVLDGGLDEAQLRRFVEQVGTALHVAHRMNVIHRDVKSGNVLLDGDGNFYLTDFGIAFIGSAADDELATALSTGSPAYASPEQLRRQELDARTDIYGFGVTLFEAATGRLPFVDAPTRTALVQRQLDDPVPLPSSVDPTVPRWVDEIVSRATAKNPADRFASMAELVAAVPSGTTRTAEQAGAVGAATVVGDLVNPFKALNAFREADAADFYGRDRLVARLVEVLARPGSAGRLLAVVGPSGSGKSSVVRSGLVPALRRGAIPGSSDWFIATMLPGSHPFDELESALSRVAVRQPGPLVKMMRSDERGIARAVKQILPTEDSELLLVVDQFEELFTLTPSADAEKFIDGLLAAVREPRARLRVALTIRADFWDHPLRHPALAARLETAAVTVSPLAADELEAAIVEPVRRQGATYEPGLVARIMAGVNDQPGALPLLQYALTELFDTHVSGLIRAESYEAIGGLSGALASRAEQVLSELTEPQQVAARRLFGRLVTLGEGTEDTRRRVRLGELRDDPDTTAVVDAFGEARLLVFDHDPATREPTVEVAHEALIRAWPRLRGWLDDDRDGLRIHRHLTETTGAWLASGRDDGELYRGARLESAETWAVDHRGDMNDVERDFLAASIAVRAAEVEAERNHAEQQARSNRRLRVLASIAVVIALVAAVAGVVALQQRESADTARAQAERSQADAESSAATAEDLRADAEQQALVESARRIGALALSAIDDDVDLAVQLAIESASRAAQAGVEVSDARQALYDTTLRHDLVARIPTWDVEGATDPLVAVAPSGTRFAVVADGSATGERRVEIHDLGGGTPVVAEVDRPTSVAWVPSGDRLLVGSEGGWIWSIDSATGDATEFHDAGADWVKVWQVTDRWLVYQTGNGPVSALASFVVAGVDDLQPVVEFDDELLLVVSPSDEELLLVGDTHWPYLHELPSGDLLVETQPHDRGGWAPDGDSFLMVEEGGTVLRRLDVADLATTTSPLTELTTTPTSFAPSPDGRLVALGSLSGVVRTYDAETTDLVAVHRGHTGGVFSLEWASDGKTLFSIGASTAGPEVLVWNVDRAPRASASVWAGAPDYPVGHVVHSETERIVEAYAGQTDIQTFLRPELWSPGAVSEPFDADLTAPSVASADGALLAVRRPSVDGLLVHDVATRSTVLDVVGDHDVPLAISPDGRTLIAANFPDTSSGLEPDIAAIDIPSGDVRWTVSGAQVPVGAGRTTAFVENGATVVIATGNAFGYPDHDRPAELLAVEVVSGEITASRPLVSDRTTVAVSPDGSRLATAHEGGRVRIIDVEAWLRGLGGEGIAATTLADETLPLATAFSEDGRTLYTPAGDRSSTLLALDVDDELVVEWQLDTDVNDTGGFPASRPTVYDGHVWIAAPSPRPIESDLASEFGLVGIPTDLEAFIEWARTVPTRDLTEAECQQFLGGRCTDTVTRSG